MPTANEIILVDLALTLSNNPGHSPGNNGLAQSWVTTNHTGPFIDSGLLSQELRKGQEEYEESRQQEHVASAPTLGRVSRQS